MRRLLCRLGLHLWRVSGYWHLASDDAGTIYTCRCGSTRHEDGDVTWWDMTGRRE